MLLDSRKGIRGEMRIRENLEDELWRKAKQLEESNQELEPFSYSLTRRAREGLVAPLFPYVSLRFICSNANSCLACDAAS